jgi:hypothetical protein
MHSESVPGLHGRPSGLSIPLRIGRKGGSGKIPALFLCVRILGDDAVGCGGGGIRTLDTPLRGITDDLFTTVLSRSRFPLPKPDFRRRRYSLFTGIRGGLVYRLVYISADAEG